VDGLRQQAARGHIIVDRVAGVDGGPDGDHQLHAHLLELFHHRGRVGPVAGIHRPIAHHAPVEIIRDDDRQGQPALFVFTHHSQQLFLGAIAQLALPEAQGEIGQERRAASGVDVPGVDLGGGVARHDIVVQAARGIHHPACLVGSQLHAPDAGIIPQEAITQAGDVERNANLGVALLQVDHRALVIQQAVLVLAQAVNALARRGAKGDLHARQVAALRAIPAGRRLVENRLRFLEQHRAGEGVVEVQRAICPQLGAQLAIGQHGLVAWRGNQIAGGRGRHASGCAGGGESLLQRAGDGRKIAQVGGAHAHAVGTPRLDLEDFAVQAPVKRCAIDGVSQVHRSSFPFLIIHSDALIIYLSNP